MAIGTGSIFAGRFPHNLDAKDRLTIPSKWRSGDDGPDAQLLLLPMSGGYLLVLQGQKVQRLEEVSKAISLGDAEGRRVTRRLFSLAEVVRCDSQGRISLPQQLKKHAGIDREALLVGQLDSFEIWNPERYETDLDGDEELGSADDILQRLGF